MGQILKIALILFCLWLVLRLIKNALGRHKPPAPTQLPAADMLRCDYCGVYLPRTEAITDRTKVYCTPEHADADRLKN